MEGRNDLIFVTGNKHKYIEAKQIAEKYGINLQAKDLKVIEIQSNNSIEVARAKAKVAFQMLKSPVVVHDSGWSIPSLNGFPGAYMHDIARWLKVEDWLNLMKSYSDRSIEVCENVVYYDETIVKCFQYRQKGFFIDEPRGVNGNSLEKVVVLAGDKTIAEHHDISLDKHSVALQAWEDCFKWYQNDKVRSRIC